MDKKVRCTVRDEYGHRCTKKTGHESAHLAFKREFVDVPPAEPEPEPAVETEE